MRRILAALALLSMLGSPILAQEPEVQAVEGKYRFQYVPVLTHPNGAESALYFISQDTFDSYADCVKGIKRSDRLFRDGMMNYRKMPLKGIRGFASCHVVGQGSFDMMFPVED